MLAKTCANRQCGRRFAAGFDARVDYACADDIEVELANLAGDWHDAAFQMNVTAKLCPSVRAPAKHFVLSWAPSERPSLRQMFAAGHRAVCALGGEKHQYVMAVHSNASGDHLHIILNLIHPTTGIALRSGHDFAKLEQVCRQVEVENGWPQDRGRFDCRIEHGVATLVPKPKEHWEKKTADRSAGLRPDGHATRAYERRTGLPALRDALSVATLSTLRAQLDRAASWQDVHLSMAKENLQYIPYRSGARIARQVGDWAMAACHLGTAYGLGQMQKRFGPFVQPSAQPDLFQSSTKTDQTRLPFAALVTFMREPLNAIKAHRQEHTQVRSEYKNAKLTFCAALLAEANAMRQGLDGKRAPVCQALRSAMRRQHCVEKRRWRSEHPLPARPTTNTAPLLARLFPQIATLRQHRNRLRAKLSSNDTSLGSCIFTDHTDVRQTWALTACEAASQHDEHIEQILDHHTDDIRSDGHGNLLFARRDGNGGIVDFEILTGPEFKIVSQERDDGGDGLLLIGPRNANVLLLVADAQSALKNINHEAVPQPLVVSMGKSLGERAASLLTDLARGRSCNIDVNDHPNSESVHARLVALLAEIDGPALLSTDRDYDLPN